MEQWQWKGALHSPKLQHHWNLTIRLFRVICRTLVGDGGLTLLQRCCQFILQSQLIGQKSLFFLVLYNDKDLAKTPPNLWKLIISNFNCCKIYKKYFPVSWIKQNLVIVWIFCVGYIYLVIRISFTTYFGLFFFWGGAFSEHFSKSGFLLTKNLRHL